MSGFNKKRRRKNAYRSKEKRNQKRCYILKKILNEEKLSDCSKNLLENGWVEKIDGEYELSKKFILQFKQFILDNSDDYKECEICKILVKNAKYHDFAKSAWMM